MQRLGQLETVIMDRMWSFNGAAAVRDILEDLQRDREIAYMTVKTVMDALHRKGLLIREPDGRAFRYRPTRTREQHAAAHMSEVLAGGSDRTRTLLHFLEQIPPDEVEQLRAVLDQAGNTKTRAPE